MARQVQGFVLAAALILWAVWPTPYSWSLLAAYGVAWCAANLLSARARIDLSPLVKWTALVVALALAAPAGYRLRGQWLAKEGYRGLTSQLADRLRLGGEPTMYPAVVFHDRPQTYYAWMSGAGQLEARFGSGASPVTGIALGDGLFRVQFDPRVQGQRLSEEGPLAVTLQVDGRDHELEFDQVHPLAHPRWFASSPGLGMAATASEETDEVFVLSRLGLEATLDTADGPSDVAFVGQDHSRLAISHRYSSDLWFLPADGSGSPSRIDIGFFQHRLASTPDGDHLAVAVRGDSPRIELVDTSPVNRLEPLHLSFRPDWLAFGASRDALVVSSRENRSLHHFLRDETGVWHERQPLELGRPVASLARSTDGRTIYAAVTDYSPDGAQRTANHFIQDQILVVDLETWAVTDRVLTARRTNRQTRAGSVDSGASPLGLVGRADGSLLVAFAGSEEVWMLPGGAHHPERVVNGHDLDLATPVGVADLGDGVWAASSPAGGAIAIYDGTGELVEFLGVSPSDTELRAANEGSTRRLALDLRAGERAFYEATRTGISCQSCHLHGETDHTAHNIGQRPLLPTLTVRGIRGTSPYLRDGSFPRIRDLDTHLAKTLYRGYQRRLSGRGRALESYVENLPGVLNPAALGERDIDREREGARQFTRAGCDLCHAFPALTNLSKHPVRALFPAYGSKQLRTSMIDTPSLLGSHQRAHFLQDGRAHGLFDVLEAENEANRHGDSAALSDAEKRDLIHFLESL